MLVSIYNIADTERVHARREPVGKPQMLIGRDAKCDIRIADDPEVAARHATIAVRMVGGEVVAEIVLTPLAGSTLVNGKVVSNTTTTRMGDTIQLGNTVLKFRPDNAQASSPRIVLPAGEPPVKKPRAVLTVPPVKNAIAAPPPRRTRNPTGRVALPPTAKTMPPPAPIPPQVPPGLANPPAPWRPAPVASVAALPARAGTYKPILSPDATENSFLSAIRRTPSDLATRAVYADWLEQRGYGSLAEFVRTPAHLDGPRYLGGCDADWRAITSRTPIEACGRQGCPGSWDNLASTMDDDRARQCGTCRRRVYFVHDHFLLHDLGLYRLPFALDASVDRVSAHQFYAGSPGEPVSTIRDDEGPATLPDGSAFRGEPDK